MRTTPMTQEERAELKRLAEESLPGLVELPAEALLSALVTLEAVERERDKAATRAVTSERFRDEDARSHMREAADYAEYRKKLLARAEAAEQRIAALEAHVRGKAAAWGRSADLLAEANKSEQADAVAWTLRALAAELLALVPDLPTGGQKG